jgi:Fe-S cluster assembly protein SufB
MELSTYFRINAKNTGQFERTLIVADEGSQVSYLEGCTAPMRDENQLHAAVVELVALDGATIKYSTIQNWYPRRQGRQGRHLQLRHQARQGDDEREDHLDPGRDRLGDYLEVSELHPAGRQLDRRVLLGGDDQQLAAGGHRHQDDPSRPEHAQHHRVEGHFPPATARTPTGARSRSARTRTERATTRSATRCSSATSAARTRSRTLEIKNTSAKVEHEASTSKIGEDQIFYCRQRGISMEDAVNMIVSGFCKEVFRELPMEFAVEAQKLLSISLEGSVG